MEMKKDKRRGVAVIIVLGVLSLMMMMAVAFSVSMRIERRSAGNYSNQITTKNLVWAGLSRAISAIDASMTGSNPADVYPNWDVLWTSNGFTRVRLGRGEAMEYIPAALHSLAGGTVSDWNSMGVGNTSQGRYAYLILNCSDFLDANFVGGMDRGGGTNANEIQIADLPSIVDEDEFAVEREKDVRYETLQELLALNDEVQTDPELLVTYSRYPHDDDLVSLVGTRNDLERRQSAIESALDDKDIIYRGEGRFIFNSLLDYIDEDHVPNSTADALGAPYVERVPMINEIWVDRLDVTRTADSCDLSKPQFVVELAYPFVEGNTESFELELEVAVTAVDSNGVERLARTEATVSKAATMGSPYSKVVFRQEIGRSLFPISFAATNTLGLTLELEMKCRVLLTSGSDSGEAVDAAPYPVGDNGFKFPIPIAAGVGDQRLGPTPSWECVDPRFNWDIPDGNGRIRNQWANDTGTNTELAINIRTSDFFAQYPRAGGYDTNLQMRVSNRGTLFSVGELGYLLRKNHLRNRHQTIRILDLADNPTARDTRRDFVMEAFTVETNNVRRGLVNINSLETNIVQTAFLDIPLGYPESARSIPDTTASGVASEIVSNGPYTNVVQILDEDWANYAGMDINTYTELERESVITHAYNLLGVRQNLFTVIVAASPASMAIGTYADATEQVQALGEKRAIAQIWRDPFPNDDGRHECFVQFFKWVE